MPRLTLPPGTRLGGYEIVSALGAGGTGEVYRARDPRLDRQVAIKLLPGELAADPHARERLRREAIRSPPRFAALLNKMGVNR